MPLKVRSESCQITRSCEVIKGNKKEKASHFTHLSFSGIRARKRVFNLIFKDKVRRFGCLEKTHHLLFRLFAEFGLFWRHGTWADADTVFDQPKIGENRKFFATESVLSTFIPSSLIPSSLMASSSLKLVPGIGTCTATISEIFSWLEKMCWYYECLKSDLCHVKLKIA